MKIKKQKKKEGLIPLRLVFVFSFTVILVLVFSMIVLGLIVGFLYYFKMLERPKPYFFLIYAVTISLTSGTLLSMLVGRIVFAPIKELNAAMKEVAGGNFSKHLSEQHKIIEVRDMAANFNIMTHELAGTEIIHQDFIQNVSHEFKTPLSTIEGYAALLQSSHLAEEKRTQYAAKIIESTKRLTNLTGNILLLSKLEHQQTPILKQNFSLDELLRHVILSREQLYEDRNITIENSLDTISILGNEDLIYQAFDNLLGNAIKFSADHTTITLSLKKESNGCQIRIQDQGIGMNQETQNRLFEKFYQGDHTHSAAGNGLGLALTRKIIDIHQGTIEVESSEGIGSCFIITLPFIN